MSEALADLAARERLRLDQFRALLALDQLARALGDALLSECPAGNGRSPQTSAWQAAFALCRSFAAAFEHALRHIANSRVTRGWREHLPAVLLRLFQHRQIEFLLQPYTGEHSIPDCWAGLHGAYRFAEAAGLLFEPLVSRRSHDGRGEPSTLEREYIHVLLMQLLNDGRLSPLEATWLSRRIPGWCALLSLQPVDAGSALENADACFVVDLDSVAGLVRPSRSAAGTLRRLDPAPMLAQIADEIAALTDPDLPRDRSSPFRRGRQLKLLRAVSAICRPRNAPVNRRGERRPVASAVHVRVGLLQIVRALYHGGGSGSLAPAAALADVQETANGASGDPDTLRLAEVPSAGAPASPDATAGPGGADEAWQIRDRSESGCRLRGRLRHSNRALPGALVAFRERDDAAWTLAVVRRLKMRIGDRVDIGVEYLGRNPVVVGLAADDPEAGDSHAASSRRRGVALYLPEGTGYPNLPFATLVLPPHEFKSGRRLNLLADGTRHPVRLKEPIEEQDRFVWSPYEAVFRLAIDGAAPIGPDDGRSAAGDLHDPPRRAIRSV